MEFVKMHGIGNDFVIVNCIYGEPDFDPGTVARLVCDRHYGIGADGLMFVCPSDRADFEMKLWNSDGSRAEMCGNGIRCFAKYVYDNVLTDSTELDVYTLDGIKHISLNVIDEKVIGVTVDMGLPVLRSNNLNKSISESITRQEAVEVIELGGQSYRMVFLNLGVPHAVIFAGDLDQVPFYELGPALECHPRFPEKANIDFTQVLNDKQIKVRVWERGAGETLACGTGASSAAVASMLLGFTRNEVEVKLPGGTLKITINETGRVTMNGPATEVFRGNMEV